MAEPRRCPWCVGDPEMTAYHDDEWGVPLHDDRRIFEFLVLETAQAGLSWSTILHRRNGYRAAFARFDVDRVARFGAKDIGRLLKDARIIRNRLKVQATVTNAQAFQAVRDEFGSFDHYMWGFVDGLPKQGRRRSLSQLPAHTPESARFSEDLRSRGFKFIGPTVVYAHMQATGMVNDHLVSCFRHAEVKRLDAR